MTELDQLIAAAFDSEGKQEQVNKVYLSLLNTQLYLPADKQAQPITPDDEPFVPLYTKQDEHYFMGIPLFCTSAINRSAPGIGSFPRYNVPSRSTNSASGIGKSLLALSFAKVFMLTSFPSMLSPALLRL